MDELKAIKTSSQFYTDYEFDAESKIDAIKQRLNFQEDSQPKTSKLWPKMLITAAIAIMIASAGIWFFNNNKETATDQLAKINDIAPGRQGATLTLATGKVIELSDAKSGVVVGSELKYNDGSAVRYSSGTSSSGSLKGSQNSSGPVGVHSLTPNSMMYIARTAKGQTYQFTLPDGTKVWLNADSKLEFPSNFVNSKTRNVKLIGEGYFEVAKDRAHPFIVEGRGQEVKVLGTHFNINSYADEGSVKTTLLEGSVRLTPPSSPGESLRKGKRSVILKPGDQGTMNSIGKISVAEVNVNKAVAWKNGKFVFEYEPIEGVMRKLARWYDAEVVYKGDFSGKTFTGSISRFDNISKILEKITYTQDVHFKIEGRRITVMP